MILLLNLETKMSCLKEVNLLQNNKISSITIQYTVYRQRCDRTLDEL